MPLLMAFRRFWAFLFVAILALPTIGLFTSDLPAPRPTVLEPEARWWADAARRLDPYINDVFGFRGAVLTAHGRYMSFMGQPLGDRIIEGEGGTLFLRDNGALEQSLGQLIRPQAIDRYIALTGKLAREMAARGASFVTLIPPNSHTGNFEELPAYARRQKTTPTEYDLAAARLTQKGIPFVDVRPLLEAAKNHGRTYFRYDTHWNERSALIAFNAAMQAIGRPDLAVSAQDALGPATPRTGNELLRMAGLPERQPQEIYFPWKPPFAPRDDLPPLEGVAPTKANDSPFFPTRAYTTGHDGPRIMVVGDSFTRNFWLGLLTGRASAFVWTHHQQCDFDQGTIARFKPDILIYAPTERFFPCLGARNAAAAVGAVPDPAPAPSPITGALPGAPAAP